MSIEAAWAHVGVRVARLRRARKLTTRELARVADVSESQVWRLECGELQNVSALDAVLIALGASPLEVASVNAILAGDP